MHIQWKQGDEQCSHRMFHHTFLFSAFKALYCITVWKKENQARPPRQNISQECTNRQTDRQIKTSDILAQINGN